MVHGLGKLIISKNGISRRRVVSTQHFRILRIIDWGMPGLRRYPRRAGNERSHWRDGARPHCGVCCYRFGQLHNLPSFITTRTFGSVRLQVDFERKARAISGISTSRSRIRAWSTRCSRNMASLQRKPSPNRTSPRTSTPSAPICGHGVLPSARRTPHTLDVQGVFWRGWRRARRHGRQRRHAILQRPERSERPQ